MENVTQLCISEISSQNVRPFVRKLSGQLTLLGVDFAIANIAADIVFLHLTHLHCKSFDVDTVSAFPKLA